MRAENGRACGAAARHRRRCRRGGMTLVELLMALGIMVLISSAVGAMLTATAYGTDSDHDLRGLAVRSKSATMRLDAALRGSRSVLSVGGDASGGWLVLWNVDADGNGQPSLHEIRRLDYDAAAETLTSSAVAEGVADIAYDTTTNYAAETSARIAAGDMTRQRWIEGLEAIDVRFDDADYRLAKLLGYRLTIRVNGQAETLIGAAALRNGGDSW